MIETIKDFIIPSMLYYYYRPGGNITIRVKLESFLSFPWQNCQVHLRKHYFPSVSIFVCCFFRDWLLET